jgi:hypothetical protein
VCETWSWSAASRRHLMTVKLSVKLGPLLLCKDSSMARAQQATSEGRACGGPAACQQ